MAVLLLQLVAVYQNFVGMALHHGKRRIVRDAVFTTLVDVTFAAFNGEHTYSTRLAITTKCGNKMVLGSGATGSRIG